MSASCCVREKSGDIAVYLYSVGKATPIWAISLLINEKTKVNGQGRYRTDLSSGTLNFLLLYIKGQSLNKIFVLKKKKK